ncbi:MAG: ATP-binding cassette domain-containing protein [Proteobacteria bacterium]|nr:ATP-binding cassette domain-containing protein [Pseudomonadota bacterium]
MSAIETKSLTKVFKKDFSKKKIIALKSLSLKIEEGEVFGFLGPNGAGKSTTIKILLNLIRPTSGTVTIMGKNPSDKNVRKLVGYLPENPYFYDHLSAKELLWFGGKSCNMAAPAIRERTLQLLEELELIDAMKRPLRSYSKGMVQRAGLALALIHDPQILILDEPMSGLDPMGRIKVFNLILKLKEEGKTIFFSSHILHDIERLCDRAAILINGDLIRLIDVKNDLHQGETLESIFMDEVKRSGGLRE